MKKIIFCTIIMLNISVNSFAVTINPDPIQTPAGKLLIQQIPPKKPVEKSFIQKIDDYISDIAFVKYIRSFKKQTKKDVSVFSEKQGVDQMFLKMGKNKEVNMKKIDAFEKKQINKLKRLDKEITNTLKEIKK